VSGGGKAAAGGLAHADVLRSLTSDCVHCGFCLPTCPTYLLWREEMDSPRGRIQLMEAGLDGTISLNETVTTHFDRCLGCLACVTACPSGVQYDRLIEATRERVETETSRGLGDRFVRGALFALLPYPRRMAAALRLAPIGRALPLPGRLGAMTEIAPPWRSTEKPDRVTPARGETRGRVGILTGCVQSVVFGSVNTATARVLAADGYEVVAPAQGCCGALSMHAGRGEEGRAFARRVIEAFADVETVIVNTSGCGSHLKELGHVLAGDPAWGGRGAELSARVRDLGEFLAGVEPRASRHPLNLTVAMQDSCHLRHAQRLPLSSAASLARIPGLRVVEPAEQDICCGSAGIYNVTQPEAARALGDRKAAGPVGEASAVTPERPTRVARAPEAAVPRGPRPAPAPSATGTGHPSGGSPTEAAAGRPPGRDELTLAWPDDVLPRLRPLTKALYREGRFLGEEGSLVLFGLPNEPHRAKCEAQRGEVEAALTARFGTPVRLKLVLDRGGGDGRSPGGTRGALRAVPDLEEPGLPEEEQVDPEDLVDADEIEIPSAIDRLTQAFPGAEIIDEDRT